MQAPKPTNVTVSPLVSTLQTFGVLDVTEVVAVAGGAHDGREAEELVRRRGDVGDGGRGGDGLADREGLGGAGAGKVVRARGHLGVQGARADADIGDGEAIGGADGRRRRPSQTATPSPLVLTVAVKPPPNTPLVGLFVMVGDSGVAFPTTAVASELELPT